MAQLLPDADLISSILMGLLPSSTPQVAPQAGGLTPPGTPTGTPQAASTPTATAAPTMTPGGQWAVNNWMGPTPTIPASYWATNSAPVPQAPSMGNVGLAGVDPPALAPQELVKIGWIPLENGKWLPPTQMTLDQQLAKAVSGTLQKGSPSMSPQQAVSLGQQLLTSGNPSRAILYEALGIPNSGYPQPQGTSTLPPGTQSSTPPPLPTGTPTGATPGTIAPRTPASTTWTPGPGPGGEPPLGFAKEFFTGTSDYGGANSIAELMRRQQTGADFYTSGPYAGSQFNPLWFTQGMPAELQPKPAYAPTDTAKLGTNQIEALALGTQPGGSGVPTASQAMAPTNMNTGYKAGAAASPYSNYSSQSFNPLLSLSATGQNSSMRQSMPTWNSSTKAFSWS